MTHCIPKINQRPRNILGGTVTKKHLYMPPNRWATPSQIFALWHTPSAVRKAGCVGHIHIVLTETEVLWQIHMPLRFASDVVNTLFLFMYSMFGSIHLPEPVLRVSKYVLVMCPDQVFLVPHQNVLVDAECFWALMMELPQPPQGILLFDSCQIFGGNMEWINYSLSWICCDVRLPLSNVTLINDWASYRWGYVRAVFGLCCCSYSYIPLQQHISILVWLSYCFWIILCSNLEFYIVLPAVPCFIVITTKVFIKIAFHCFADIDLRNIIDKLAQFVARNGLEFEQMTKNKQKENPKFSFLFGGEHFNYYQYKVTTEQASKLPSALRSRYYVCYVTLMNG